MMLALFFVAAALVVYHYLLYPAAVILAARLRAPEPEETLPDVATLPALTLLIAAYNEERVIESKLRNSLTLDYPRDRLEVIVVSDGSSDDTPAIVRRFADRGVVSLHEPARRGKTAALNRGVAAARGELVVFSDANNLFDPDALMRLVARFRDPRVGGACGLKSILDAGERESSQGDSLYWRYESAVKLAESRLGSITGADGEIFAVRKHLYRPLDERLINDDAAITFDIVRQGHRVIYEPRAVSREPASLRLEDDFFVKVRMVSGGFQTVAFYRRDLLPPRSWFALAFLSHKLLRWLMPVFLVMVFVTSAVLALRPFFLVFLVLQSVFYLLAVLGWLLRRRRPATLLYFPCYFTVMNLAALTGLYRYLLHSQTTLWRKAER